MRFAATFLLCVIALSAHATTPLVDQTFGTNANGLAGLAVGQSASSNYLASAGVQPDGKVLLFGQDFVGIGQSAYVARLNTDGSVDTSFGETGTGSTNLGMGFNLRANVVAGNGDILFAGDDGSTINAVVGRLTSGGALDPSFHSSGFRELVPTAFGSIYANSEFDAVFSLEDGKVLAVGYALTTSVPSACGMAAQFNSDGSLDSSFGNGSGSVCVAPPYSGAPIFEVTAALRLSSGNIILAGGADHTGGSNLDIAMTQLLPSGEIDTSFGNSGWATFGFDAGGALEDYAMSIASDSQNRLLLGVVYTTDQGIAQAVMRYTATGQLDASFGTNGIAAVPGDETLNLAPYGLWMLPGGDIMVASISFNVGTSILQLTEIDANGQLVNAFAPDGTFNVAVPTGFDATARPFAIRDYIYSSGPSSTTGLSALRVILPIFNNGFD
jgi:uncharacterized delta-60 repeat protein